jgi:Helix-turn-helix family
MISSRELWYRFELVHDVFYFSPRTAEAARALGLKGYWMGYFAFRAAPLGPVGPATVTAAFFGFHRSRVGRALPDAWSYTTPEAALAARAAAVDAALVDVAGPAADGLDEAAELAWQAAQAADTAGRPLAAANQALPRPGNARIALWQATSTLREHRGDGHNAVLVCRGIRPAEAHLLKAAAGEADADVLRTGRGFPEDEWDRARAGLRDRGLLDGAGGLTPAGRAERAEIEAATDRIARQPWDALGEDGTARLLALLHPLAVAALDSGLLPQPSPVGLVWTVPERP